MKRALLLGINQAAPVIVCWGLLGLFAYSALSPFYGPTQTVYWFPDPVNPAHHLFANAPLMLMIEGEPFPIGRTVCLWRDTPANINKELDGPNGETWPIYGSGSRALRTGCQSRVSATLMPTPGFGAPVPGSVLTFRVSFTVPRLFLPPAIVPLKDVKVYVTTMGGPIPAALKPQLVEYQNLPGRQMIIPGDNQ